MYQPTSGSFKIEQILHLKPGLQYNNNCKYNEYYGKYVHILNYLVIIKNVIITTFNTTTCTTAFHSGDDLEYNDFIS